MPKLTQTVPKYSKHKKSGQAFVKIEGQYHYLGPHGTKTSHRLYDQIVMQWLANGRRLPSETDEDEYSITQLCVDYYCHCESYYRKDGKTTDEVTTTKSALRHIRALYGEMEAKDFGPKKLKVVRESMIRAHWCRTHINKQISRIKRMFRWAVEEELVPGNVYQDIKSLNGLKAGRSAAKETSKVQPVDHQVIHRTLEYMLKIPADMVRIQLLTGARPSEICSMRPRDVDVEGDVWI